MIFIYSQTSDTNYYTYPNNNFKLLNTCYINKIFVALLDNK